MNTTNTITVARESLLKWVILEREDLAQQVSCPCSRIDKGDLENASWYLVAVKKAESSYRKRSENYMEAKDDLRDAQAEERRAYQRLMSENAIRWARFLSLFSKLLRFELHVLSHQIQPATTDVVVVAEFLDCRTHQWLQLLQAQVMEFFDWHASVTQITELTSSCFTVWLHRYPVFPVLSSKRLV